MTTSNILTKILLYLKPKTRLPDFEKQPIKSKLILSLGPSWLHRWFRLLNVLSGERVGGLLNVLSSGRVGGILTSQNVNNSQSRIPYPT